MLVLYTQWIQVKSSLVIIMYAASDMGLPAAYSLYVEGFMLDKLKATTVDLCLQVLLAWCGSSCGPSSSLTVQTLTHGYQSGRDATSPRHSRTR